MEIPGDNLVASYQAELVKWDTEQAAQVAEIESLAALRQRVCAEYQRALGQRDHLNTLRHQALRQLLTKQSLGLCSAEFYPGEDFGLHLTVTSTPPQSLGVYPSVALRYVFSQRPNPEHGSSSPEKRVLRLCPDHFPVEQGRFRLERQMPQQIAFLYRHFPGVIIEEVVGNPETGFTFISNGQAVGKDALYLIGPVPEAVFTHFQISPLPQVLARP